MNDPRRDLPSLDELGRRLQSAAAKRRSRSGAARLRRPAVAVPALVALAVGLAFTPPGRAVTSEVAALMGVGEVGGPPTQPSEVGHFGPATDQIVLATGKTASGEPFEIVAYRSDRSQPREPPRTNGTVCLKVEFPTSPPDQSGNCYQGALRFGAMCCPGLTFPRGERPGIPRLRGHIRPGVTRVEVSYVDHQESAKAVEAVIGMIKPEFAERLGVEHPSGLFFASLPGLARGDQVEISAFNSAGKLLETETLLGRDEVIRDQQRKFLAALEAFMDAGCTGDQDVLNREGRSPRCQNLYDRIRKGAAP